MPAMLDNTAQMDKSALVHNLQKKSKAGGGRAAGKRREGQTFTFILVAPCCRYFSVVVSVVAV